MKVFLLAHFKPLQVAHLYRYNHDICKTGFAECLHYAQTGLTRGTARQSCLCKIGCRRFWKRFPRRRRLTRGTACQSCSRKIGCRRFGMRFSAHRRLTRGTARQSSVCRIAYLSILVRFSSRRMPCTLCFVQKLKVHIHSYKI